MSDQGTKQKKKSFEQSVSRLDEIVKMLEKGDVPLDQALTLFEEGTHLVKDCSAILNNAEQKLKALVNGGEEQPAQE